MDTSALEQQNVKNTSVLNIGQDTLMIHIGLGALMLLYQCAPKCKKTQNTVVLNFGSKNFVLYDPCALEC
jgi:hypothetical protein